MRLDEQSSEHTRTRRISGAAARRLLAALLAVGALAAFTASPAVAARGHVLSPLHIGAACVGQPCELSDPAGLAVNEATGVLYVVDKGNDRVERFDAATGAYLGQFDGGPTYEKEPGVTAPTTEAGHGGGAEEFESGPFDEPEAIAVDNSCHLHQPPLTEATTPKCSEFDPSYGDVYVVDANGHEAGGLAEPNKNPVVDKFSPTGAYLGQITRNLTGEEFSANGFRELFGVAVDPRGEVWVYENNFGPVFHERVANYSNAQPNLRLASREAAGGEPRFAVDSTDHLYVGFFKGKDNLVHIAKYTSAGGNLGGGPSEIEHEFGLPPASAVATEATTDHVYVDNETAWRRYSPEEREFESLTIPGGHGTALAVEGATTPGTSTVYAADSSTDLVYVYPPEPPGPPTVEVGSTSVADVTSVSAQLLGEINPRSEPGEAPTTYRFEYLTQAAWEADGDSFEGVDAPARTPDEGLEANYEPDPVAAALAGLQPGTTYHFRLSAENSLSLTPTLGEERTFTTQTPAPASLPDHRAYELVSPAQKFGALLERPIFRLAQASASGDAVTYLANAPTEANPPGFSEFVEVLSRRAGPAAAPWLSADIATPHATAPGHNNSGTEYQFFSSDLSHALVHPSGPFTALSPEATERTPYLRTDFPPGDLAAPCASSCYRPLVTEANDTAEPFVPFGQEDSCNETCGPRVLGASPDASHVVLSSEVPLTEDAPPAPGSEPFKSSLYEWSAGRLALLSLRPAAEGGAPVPLAAKPALGSSGPGGGQYDIARHAISADGSRVVFSEAEPAGVGGSKHGLYLRDTAAEETLRLDLVQGGSGAGQVEPIFQDATPDDSRIFFTDTQQLLPGASTAGADLYECQIEAGEEGLKCNLHDLTAQGSGEPAQVLGLIAGVSADGSSVYFTADGVLAPGAQPGTCTAAAAQPPAATCNLYLRRAGQTRLVAVLSGADFPDWALHVGGLRYLITRVTPSGRYLAFSSQRSLTGYDNRDAATGLPDQELFLYDANADAGQGKLLCASCNPTGARPHGVEYRRLNLADGAGSEWPQNSGIAAGIAGWIQIREGGIALYQPRYLSDSGRLFFNAADSLVPGDSNGTEDVYQYEPLNGGESPPPNDTCTTASPTYSPASSGCIDLISSGTSKEESAFMDASESGSDVFFLTASRLSKRDEDTALDLYDARSGGGEAEAVKPVECSGDACQNPATPPNHPTPGTALVNGPGNEVQCPKGKVKKSGKCVARKHKKSQKKHQKVKRKRANSNRGGHK